MASCQYPTSAVPRVTTLRSRFFWLEVEAHRHKCALSLWPTSVGQALRSALLLAQLQLEFADFRFQRFDSLQCVDLGGDVLLNADKVG